MKPIKYGLTALMLALGGHVSAQVPPAIDCAVELYGGTNDGELIAVNMMDGTAQLLTAIPAPTVGTGAGEVTEIEYEFSTNKIWLESTNGATAFWSIDADTFGVIDDLAHAPVAYNGMEFVDGALYTVLNTGGTGAEFGTIDLTTSDFVTIGATGLSTPVTGLAYDEAAGVLYGVTGGGGLADLVTFDIATGAASLVGSTGVERLGSLELGPNGQLYAGTASNAAVDPNSLFQIDPATGAATLIGPSGFSLTGLAACALPLGTPMAVPAMSPIGLTLLLLVLAVAGIVVVRRTA